MNQEEIDRLWFSLSNVPGALFKFDDAVDIITGEHKGKGGTVLSLLLLEPEPVYMIELGSGEGDVKIKEANLKASE